jgi:hypothetical protein
VHIDAVGGEKVSLFVKGGHYLVDAAYNFWF